MIASGWAVRVSTKARHFRIAELKSSRAALIKLSEPIEFDAADGEPVDIIFGMMVPTELDDGDFADIKMVTTMLADEALRGRLRSTNSSSDLYKALLDGSSLLAPEDLRVAQGS
jgi:PTS system nitrogen regulatory IIA component